MREQPYGYRDGRACCKDCGHAKKNSYSTRSRWRCHFILPSRAVGARKTCLNSKWRTAK